MSENFAARGLGCQYKYNTAAGNKPQHFKSKSIFKDWIRSQLCSDVMFGRYLYELPCQWNYVVWQCREDTWLGVQNPRTQTGKNNCPGENYNHTQNNLWHKWWIYQVQKLTVCHYFMETHWRFTIKRNWEKICLLRSSSFGKYWIAKFKILKRL